MKQLAHYKNGNYFVTIFDDGTKIRENDLDFLRQITQSQWTAKSLIDVLLDVLCVTKNQHQMANTEIL